MNRLWKQYLNSWISIMNLMLGSALHSSLSTINFFINPWYIMRIMWNIHDPSYFFPSLEVNQTKRIWSCYCNFRNTPLSWGLCWGGKLTDTEDSFYTREINIQKKCIQKTLPYQFIYSLPYSFFKIGLWLDLYDFSI